MAYDVISMGRVGVDIYPLETGKTLAEIHRFEKFLGGSATNVAVACARLGRKTALITRTGKDGFAPFVHNELQRFGVDDRYVTAVDSLQTPVIFCELHPPDDFPLMFYRLPKAPDLEIHANDLDMEAIANCGVFWATATGLSQEPSRSAHHAAWLERRRIPNTVLDLDWRPTFWNSKEEAAVLIRNAIHHVSVVVGNLEECEIVTGQKDPLAAARALLDLGVDLAIVKMGPRGVLGMTPTETVQIPAMQVNVVNGLGAGDGFGGAVCHGLLAQWDLKQLLAFASAAGAIVAEHLECAGAMPTQEQVMKRLAGSAS